MSTSPAPGGITLEFHRDPSAFLDVAGDYLAADPVASTVVTTIAQRTVAQLADGEEPPDWYWWLVVRDEAGAVVGAGMRTARVAPHPPYLLPMPDAAAVAVARTLCERDEQVLALNGALSAVELCAAELARLRGGTVSVSQHVRLHQVEAPVGLKPPSPAPGRLVPATEDDLELATAWFDAFMADADEQAGRPRGSTSHEVPSEDDMRRRLRSGIWFWVDAAGERVHLTAANPPAYGVARIGPVYTPPEQRGHGYASNAVAAVSRLILEAGARACLFTDQANPTSNKIYADLGYEPVVDMANLVIRR
jgi:predicted GNAT family acetyltransferase